MVWGEFRVLSLHGGSNGSKIMLITEKNTLI